MKMKHIRKLLALEIKKVADNISMYCVNPKSDFIRNRKLPADVLLKSIIGMESKSLTNELIDFFHASPDMPTSSAFSQQRCKLKPEAFKTVLDEFSCKLRKEFSDDISVLAIDGSDVQITTDPHDESSYFPGINGKKGYNLLHLNALYDLSHHIYVDALIQKRLDWNEHAALQAMVDRSDIPKALIIADRGYESYNNLAHIQEKGWFFLIRMKDGKTGIKKGLELPDTDTFDTHISLKLTRKQTKETKELFKEKNNYKLITANTTFDYLPVNNRKHASTKYYELNVRVVRFPISDGVYETVLTNLDARSYPPKRIKHLYALRWGIETSFRDLKYTIGMLDFHSKKVMCIQQEIYARLIMYNFAEMITSHVVISKKQRKHTYKANFAVAVHMCRLFFHGKTTSPILEAIIAKNLIPIRPERHCIRNRTIKVFHGFLYRVT